jgi:hypothetical protein
MIHALDHARVFWLYCRDVIRHLKGFTRRDDPPTARAPLASMNRGMSQLPE